MREPDGVHLPYDDIEFIVGISIVGGDGKASVVEDEQILFSRSKGSYKLCVCATISDSIFLRLSKRSVGVKDIIHFVEFLRARSDIVDDQDALAWIDYWEDQQTAFARSGFIGLLPNNDTLNEAWNQTQNMLRALKANLNARTSASVILSDLSMGDAVWLSIAERSLALQIAKPGDYGPVLIGARRNISNYTLNVVVAAHSGKLVESNATNLVTDGLTILSSLELGPDSPLRMLVFRDEKLERSVYGMLRDFSDELI